MKWMLIPTLLFLFPALVMAQSAPARLPDDQDHLYVSPAGNDAWTGCLALSNTEGTDGPFASAERAKQAVRKLIAEGLRRDVGVYFRAGTYYLPDGLRLEAEDSGDQSHSITYASYPGETARLVGGVRLGQWELWQKGIWQCPIPAGKVPQQVFEDNRRLDLAAAPQSGYLEVAGILDGQETSSLVYFDGDLDPNWDWGDARLFAWPTNDWFSDDKPIKSIDPANRVLHFEPMSAFRPGNRYRVRNVLALLDRPGECKIAWSEGKIYVWPVKGQPQQGELVAATADNVIRILGTEQRPVRNIHFANLDLSIANAQAVRLSGAEDCSIRFCKVENAFTHGVHLQGYVQRCEVYGNLIQYNGQDGVSLEGLTTADVCKGNRIVNNHIHHCGRLVGHGGGICLRQSGSNEILHNLVHNMPRYGISVKGPLSSARTQPSGIDEATRYAGNWSRNNRIAYNHVHHVNEDSQDTGACESWCSGPGNSLDHNLIHDSGHLEIDTQCGIYLDDGSDRWTITNNVIYGIRASGGASAITTKGIGNRIENNIIVGDGVCSVGIVSFAYSNVPAYQHTYSRNIICFDSGDRPPGGFNQGVAVDHKIGSRLSWPGVAIPADANYRVWILYSMSNAKSGLIDYSGHSSLTIGSSRPVTLMNLKDTGDWHTFAWACAGSVDLQKGRADVTWENLQGGTIIFDAWALCSDPNWTPGGRRTVNPASGHLIVVQAETHAPDGPNMKSAYHFINWSDDRITESDHNLFWDRDGTVGISGEQKGSLENWKGILGGKYDQNSLVADPMFVAPERRDYRLKPQSPALKLGFQDIDLRGVGLTDDFPRHWDSP
ncbi:MAG: right-handed parallel beta-helix repeat-containing protein [Phycisphaerae bacterium]|jgi:hypothetical protein